MRSATDSGVVKDKDNTGTNALYYYIFVRWRDAMICGGCGAGFSLRPVSTGRLRRIAPIEEAD
jgi:hypothetical protein